MNVPKGQGMSSQKNEIQNAKIDGTFLGVEDHGIMTCYVYLDYGDGGHQGFGGFGLDEPLHVDGKFVKRVGSVYGMEFIIRVLKVLEAAGWEKLPGMYCRVKMDLSKPSGFGHEIAAIGNITKDKWFAPADLWAEWGGRG